MCSIPGSYPRRRWRSGFCSTSSATIIHPATEPSTRTVRTSPLTFCNRWWGLERMAGSERPRTVGYVVSTWPRLSQTFVLREILAVERLGVSVRIFSTKDPDGEPIHGDVAQVHAEVIYLTLRGHWKPALWANLRLVRDVPAPYARTLVAALRYRRWDVLRRFFQAGYLADLLRREPVDHLHAHFATAPALVAMFTHQLRCVPYTFTAHARDIYVDTPPE